MRPLPYTGISRGSLKGFPLPPTTRRPGANIGESASVFEAVHGTAPDIAGKGVANPTAVMLAGAMMLDRMGQRDRAERLERAVRRVVAEGKDLTPDVGGRGDTRSFTDRVVKTVENG